MLESVFIRIFAGVSKDYVGAIPLIPFGQWLLTIGIFLLLVGFRAERNRKAGILTLYRHRTVLNWWKRHFKKRVASSIWTAILLLLIVLNCDIAMGNSFALSMELALKISVLWLFHVISIAALFTLLDLFSFRRFVPAVLLLFEGLTFIIGYGIRGVSHVMYGMWGMYLQSSWCETGGFLAGAAITAEVILLIASFFIGQEYLKKETNII